MANTESPYVDLAPINMAEFEADFLSLNEVALGSVAVQSELEGNSLLPGSPLEPGAIVNTPLTEEEVDRIAAQLSQNTVAISEEDERLIPGASEMFRDADIAEEQQEKQLALHSVEVFLMQTMLARESQALLQESSETTPKKSKRKKKKNNLTLAA